MTGDRLIASETGSYALAENGLLSLERTAILALGETGASGDQLLAYLRSAVSFPP